MEMHLHLMIQMQSFKIKLTDKNPNTLRVVPKELS